MISVRRIVIATLSFVLSASVLLSTERAYAVDVSPGDSCAGFNVGDYRHTGGPELPGVGHFVVCDGANWVSFLDFKDAGSILTQIGYDSGACTAAKEGRIRYSSSDTPPWEYCDGSAWSPFRQPRCQDDDTGECFSDATRSNDDPDFIAANIADGVNVLGVTGTLAGGAPDCTDDDTATCTLSATRSSDDPDFTAANIACGVNILGVTGTHSGSGGTPSPVTLFLTTGTSWQVPSDWNNAVNTIELIGAGGGGGGADNSAGDAPGGGGGAYSKATNVSLSAGATIALAIGTGGTGGVGGVSPTAGQTGGDTYFCSGISNCASITDTGVVVGAKGGGGGPGGNVQVFTPGGAAASGVGSVKYNGGQGGRSNINGGGAPRPGGGGGAAGPNGSGNDAYDILVGNDGVGGTGDAGSGGVGGGRGVPGSPGTEFDASHGSGGGGGGGASANGSPGMNGGAYGAGGGGGNAQVSGTPSGGNGGNGAQGLIVVTYTPICAP